MNKLLFIAILFLSCQAYAQTSEKYNSEYANFYRAEELFEKEQYGAARKEFRIFMDGFPEVNDPMYIKASYYEAISALNLYNNDAERLLLTFLKNYPESIYRTDIYFRLGKHYYYRKKWDDALAWFNKLSIQDVPEENRDEFYFKLGYANFKEDNIEAARNAFVEIKDGDSKYSAPALYYYSHIAYQNENYQLALEGFLKLEDHESFGKLVPYYIAQIYYLQGKYALVTQYAKKISGSDGIMDDKAINQLIGDAYYRTNRYDEAVPYLEKYNASTKTTREEDYRLGYAYFKSGNYDNAVSMFDRVKGVEDSLGQIAYYHIGQSMLKLDNKVSARSAFEGAAFIDADPVVQEDALFNYAILSYELDINPYDEAVEAFELYLDRYPNSLRKDDIYQYLVNVYLSTNNYSKALASLDKLPNKDIKLRQAYQLICFNQGVSMYQRNAWGDAIKSFEKVEKYPVDPEISAQAKYWIADSYYQANNFEKAIENYNKVGTMQGVPSGLKSEAKYNTGYSYWKIGERAFTEMEKYERGSSPFKAWNKKRESAIGSAITQFNLFLQSNPGGDQKKADANMRIADGHFVLKENANAVKYYKKVIDLHAQYEDQALYYMALTYGYMEGKSAEKVSNLLTIINNFPQSRYIQTSVLQVANTYKSDEEYDKALKYFNKIVIDYPTSIEVPRARINIADIHFKQGKPAQAEQEYKAVMNEFGSDQTICTDVANALKDMYTQTNQLDKIDDLAQYPCFDITDDEKQNLYYIPAVQAYFDSTLSVQARYTKAIPKLEEYLNKYPTGKYKDEIRFYLAEAHYGLGDEDQGIVVYQELLSGPNNIYTEYSAARVASYFFNKDDYIQAIPYYKRLEQISKDPEKLSNAKLRLMVCHYNLENWQNAALYAGKVIQDDTYPSNVLEEAHYIRAKSNYNQEYYMDAAASLFWLRDNLTSERGAEARFLLAEIKFRDGDLEGTLTEIENLLKMRPAYNYWIAKAIMLRSKVYMAQDNLFQAEQDLKSIRLHYENTTDGILDEANALWDELMQLKDAPKDIEEEGERVIEIDGGNGN
ncbi:tetratricopeptide repeat protein [Crocinitomicaceae bacterium]|nr:tetratricopeptide repeat protein [Crocinitomicaceae bacterium]